MNSFKDFIQQKSCKVKSTIEKCKVEDYLIVHCQNFMKTKGVEMKTMKHFKGCVKRNGNLPFSRMTIPL